MPFAIIGILIHDEAGIPMVGVDQCSTLHNIQAIDLVLVNTRNSTFPGGFGETLTSDPAHPPLAPLSTSEPCWACFA